MPQESSNKNITDWFEPPFSTYTEITKFYSNDYDFCLRYACCIGRLDLANAFIEDGATNFNLALEGACCGGQEKMFYFCVDHGATDFNKGMEEACSGICYINLVRLCIEYGATDFSGTLDAVCFWNNKEIIKLLKSKKPDLEKCCNKHAELFSTN